MIAGATGGAGGRLMAGGVGAGSGGATLEPPLRHGTESMSPPGVGGANGTGGALDGDGAAGGWPTGPAGRAGPLARGASGLRVAGGCTVLLGGARVWSADDAESAGLNPPADSMGACPMGGSLIPWVSCCSM